MSNLLKEYYKASVKKQLSEKFGYKNVMMVPGLKKIVLNMGAGKEAVKDRNVIVECEKELSLIAGQKAVQTKARQSISNFKLREGQAIGVKVTLRGEKMWDFFARFNNIVCPRIHDFRGFESKCDGQGNYTLGLTDQQVFPELNLDEVKRTQGMHITFVTTAATDEECVELLRLLGLPFKNLPIVCAA